MARALGLDAVEYGLVGCHGILASECPLFTTPDISFVPMRSVTRGGRIWDALEWCSKAGPSFIETVKDMLVFDCLICNEDRHFGNFGILRDNHSGKFIAPASIFDNGLSLFCHADENDLADLDRYEKTMAAACGLSLEELCAAVMGDRQGERLKGMLGFSFDSRGRRDLPEERLSAIEAHLRKRVRQLLEIPPAQ